MMEAENLYYELVEDVKRHLEVRHLTDEQDQAIADACEKICKVDEGALRLVAKEAVTSLDKDQMERFLRDVVGLSDEEIRERVTRRGDL